MGYWTFDKRKKIILNQNLICTNINAKISWQRKNKLKNHFSKIESRDKIWVEIEIFRFLDKFIYWFFFLCVLLSEGRPPFRRNFFSFCHFFFLNWLSLRHPSRWMTNNFRRRRSSRKALLKSCWNFILRGKLIIFCRSYLILNGRRKYSKHKKKKNLAKSWERRKIILKNNRFEIPKQINQQ